MPEEFILEEKQEAIKAASAENEKDLEDSLPKQEIEMKDMAKSTSDPVADDQKQSAGAGDD